MTNNEIRKYNPKPIKQGQDQRLIFTFSTSITGFTFTSYVIDPDTKIRAATYTIVIDEGTKTITLTLADTITTTLTAKEYDWELWQKDASNLDTPLLEGKLLVKVKSTAPTP